MSPPPAGAVWRLPILIQKITSDETCHDQPDNTHDNHHFFLKHTGILQKIVVIEILLTPLFLVRT